MKPASKVLSLLTSVAAALFLLSGAIAVPILWRGFYYLQIDALALPARTGFSPEVIRGAFDQVMDFLVKGAPFGTGELKWSESGMSHFADCRVLFRLDFVVLALSAALLVLILLLVKTGRVRLHRFLGQGPCFWAVAVMAGLLAVLGVWALADFDGFFTAFHTAFFPGKTNWVFDWRTDEIILILPEEFWARAAGLVAGLAFGVGVLLAVLERFLPGVGEPSVYDQLRNWRR